MARTKSVNVWAILIVIVLVLGGCSKLVSMAVGGGVAAAADATLPDLKGKTLVEVEDLVSGLDLIPRGIDGSSYCADQRACFVYRMSPKAGAVVKSGGKVAVTFLTADERSFYQRHIKMPKVVGWSEDKADAFFEPISTVVDSTPKESAKVPVEENRVVAQSPKAGKPLKVGQKIKLVVGFNLGSTSTSNGDTDVDVNVRHDGRESRFCSRRIWC